MSYLREGEGTEFWIERKEKWPKQSWEEGEIRVKIGEEGEKET